MSDTTVSAATGRWAVFTAAPHRVMFFGGTLQLVATLLFWGAELAGRYTAWWPPLATTVPAAAAHGFLMVYGLFLFFIFGFLMTTYPRWMGGPPVRRDEYVTAFLLLLAGVVVVYAGLFVHRLLVAAGVALVIGGWGRGYAALLRVYRQAPTGDRYYERWLNLAHALGLLGAALFLAALFVPGQPAPATALRIGFWLFLLPLFVTVAHRMVPFFSFCVLDDYAEVKPRWSLPVLWSGFALHAALEQAGQIAWTWPVDLILAGVVFWHAWRWQAARSLGIRLLAVLHIAVVMLGVALAAFGARSLVLLVTGTDWLGRGPLHLLAIGFLAAMVIGMATRVSLGHSGRPLEMDGYAWACFWGLIAAALLRLLGEIPTLAAFLPFNLLAVAVWLFATGAWAWRFVPIFLAPRIDGGSG